MKKSCRRGVTFAVLCLLSVNSFATPGPLAGSRPNIVFILTDDQGYGDLGCHGHPYLKTPNMDKLYSQSTRFTDYHVSPTCSPTRSALMSGRAPFAVGVTHTNSERNRVALSVTMLPELLKTAGYSTAIFGKWHMGEQDPYQPQNRGFDEVLIHGSGFISNTHPGSGSDLPGNSYFGPTLRENNIFVKSRRYCTDVFYGQALEWIKERKDQNEEPFFLYLPSNVPHGPYVVEERYKDLFSTQAISDDEMSFLGMITQLDENIGVLMQKLDEWNLADNTLVIFMSDNGSAKGYDIYNYGMKGHKGDVDEGGTRVPFFMRLPDKIAEGVDIDKLTRHYDLYPTIAEIAGVEIPPETILDGRSLVPLIDDPQTNWVDRYTFFHKGRWDKDVDPDTHKYIDYAVRNETWRLVENELYNIETDPGQTTDVAAQNPSVVSAMFAAYEAWWDSVRPLMINEDASLDVPNEWIGEHEQQEKSTGIPELMPPSSDWVLNGSFESGSQLWELKTPGTIVSNNAYQGSASLQITGAGTAAYQTIPLEPNRDYNISCWIDTSVMSSGRVVFDTWDKFDDPGEGQFVVNPGNGGWTRYSGSFNSGTETNMQIRFFTVTDVVGAAYIDHIMIEEESPPFITSIPPATVEVGAEYSYTMTAKDLNGDPVTLSRVDAPAWLSFNAETGVLSGTPSASHLGVHPLVLQASDGITAPRTQTASIRVIDPVANNAPVIDSYPVTGLSEYDVYYYIVVASDVDGDSLTFVDTDIPSWLTLNSTNGLLSGVPAEADIGVHSVTVSVTDGQETTDQEFNIRVFDIPDPVNNTVNDYSFEDNDGSWTLGSAATISSDDAIHGSVALKVDQPSTATFQEVTVTTGVTYKLSVWVNGSGITAGRIVFDTQDEYDDTCQFLISSGENWTRYTGIFTAADSSVKVRVFANAGTGYTGTTYFDKISIEPLSSIVNAGPYFTSDPVLSVEQGDLYRYVLTVVDREGDALTWTGSTVPSWLTLDPDVGLLSGIPAYSDIGNHSVELHVSDGTTSITQAFTVAVSESDGYDAWSALNGLSGGMVDDEDGDGRNNLYEYALDGAPTGPGDAGVDPVFIKTGNDFDYIHLQRNDDVTLNYAVQTTTNLVSDAWTTAGAFPLGTNLTGGVYDVVTNRVLTTELQSYIRLKIESQ